MKIKAFYVTCILLSWFSTVTFAQTQTANSGGAVIQPTIMVIPFTKEGEDIRTVLEQDVNRRIALTKVKEAFDNRGFTTIDFTAKLKAAKDNGVFTSDNQTDIKSQIIAMSGSDVFVQVEVDAEKTTTGTSVNIILTGYETSTGNSLSNKIGSSGKFYTDDIGKLTAKAIDACAEDFLNTMQNKFTDIVNNGKTVIVDFSFDQGSKYKMSSVIGASGLPLSDLLEDWMSKSALKGNYHIQGTTDLKMIFDLVRIPLRTTTNQFALQIFRFLTSNGIQPTKDVKGSTIIMTIK